MPSSVDSVLDEPVWASLTGAHARFARRVEDAARYEPEVSPFAGMPSSAGPNAWLRMGELIGPGGVAVVAAATSTPVGWDRVLEIIGVQMIGHEVEPLDDDEAELLGPGDAQEMLELAERTRPGPFLLRTPELGAYYGIRREGRLVAMAGERMHPPGFTEVSAVCTDESYRGQGLAGRLVRVVSGGILARGETPFLHAADENVGAIRLYESLGFRVRRPIVFEAYAAPAGAG